ncbi:hypothetical protein TREES_T100014880 [Tupaia chinensis]|uniref:Uncharacterized protein n=1 Tax=Tupaia chinensis TaxID=246437 RepID=L9KTC6_TUPCH|nr:hypothetical protein TREES_T100014880 [Tupaia chinensis]
MHTNSIADSGTPTTASLEESLSTRRGNSPSLHFLVESPLRGAKAGTSVQVPELSGLLADSLGLDGTIDATG